MKEKPQYNCELCDVHSNCAEHTSEPEEWDYADGLEKQLQDNKKTVRVELLEALKKQI